MRALVASAAGLVAAALWALGVWQIVDGARWLGMLALLAGVWTGVTVWTREPLLAFSYFTHEPPPEPLDASDAPPPASARS